MIDVGRLCVKIAGRDAGEKCVIVEILDKTFVMIDGNTRRRKCNIRHLEFFPQVVKLKAKASHADVAKAMAELGIEVSKKESKKKDKKAQVKKARKVAAVKKEKKKKTVKTSHHTAKKSKASKKKHQKKETKKKKPAKKKEVKK
ncbi:50S ribosomal protein L14e [Candidatus Woesearchaeota archaeon]|nr:50S ribosomal protein L14e [Candidatus Woesearchaeota archaeon]